MATLIPRTETYWGNVGLDLGYWHRLNRPRSIGAFFWNRLVDINRMALNIEFVEHTEYLEIIVSGTYDNEDAIDKFPRVLAACRNTKKAKALINFWELEGTSLVTEKVLYAWKVEEHYRNHLSTGGQKLQVAYVGQPRPAGTYEAGIEHAEIKGLPFALFDDSRKAIEWLGVKADISPQH